MGFEVRGPVPDYDGPGLDRVVFERACDAVRDRSLVLREFVAEDEAAVHEYASDPEVTRLVGWGPNTIEQTREFLAQITEPTTGLASRSHCAQPANSSADRYPASAARSTGAASSAT